jgi:hypothetical protein
VRALAVSSIIAALTLAAAVSAADAQPSLFDEAREKKLARQPKEAIALYQRAIADHRFDLPRSAPALVELVECFQLLKDDAEIAARYRELSAKWLSEPPALDGAALGLDAAEEDLLWQPWPGADGKPRPLIAFTVDSAERTKSIQGGVAKSQLRITLKAHPAADMPLQVSAFSFAESSGQALAIDPDGAQHQASEVMLSNFNGELDAYLTFDDLTASVVKLKRLSGTVAVTQRKEWKLLQVPLREGERVGEGDNAWKIAAVQREGEVSVTLRRALDLSTADGLAQVASAASSASAGAGGGGGDIWLIDDAGRRIDAHGMSSSSGNSSQSMTLSFGAIALPPTLVCLEVTKTSSRDLPFAFDGVDLP